MALEYTRYDSKYFLASFASHTLHREEGTGHVATIELLPQQKLDVTDQIALFIDHIRCHGVVVCRNVFS